MHANLEITQTQDAHIRFAKDRAVFIKSGSDKWLYADGSGSAYRITRHGDGHVTFMDIATQLYWTVRDRGMPGSLHGICLEPLGPDGDPRAEQLFKIAEREGGLVVLEPTKKELVSRGHNDWIVRWAEADGSTQVLAVEPF
jgi:hypothetical protein